MTHEDAFLRAIAEEPEEETHRLVYADWLEENSQPERAEFIRLQVELEPQRFEIDRPRVPELLKREAELLDRHHNTWLGPAIVELRSDTSSFDPALHGPFFRKGVPEVAAVSLDVLLQRGQELLAACPTLNELAVFDVQRRGAELAQCRFLEHISTLEVADWLLEEDACALLASSLFRNVPTVRVWDDGEEDPRYLWYGQPEDWPQRSGAMRIEVVEFSGVSIDGSAHDPSRLDRLDGVSKRFAESGKTLVPIRPFLTRFPLQYPERQNLHSGRLQDGRQVLVAHHKDKSVPVVFAFFDEEGYLTDAQETADPGCCEYYEDYPLWLAKELGYCSCMIWMREFQTYQGLGVQLLPSWLVGSLVFDPVRSEG